MLQSKNELMDFRTRREKARKIIAILEDFIGENHLSDLLVLEVGCSAGGMTDVFAKHFKQIIAVDIDDNALKLAKKRNKHQNTVFKFADALSLPFKKETFDVIICNHVYEHLKDAKKLMDEIYRVLKINGVCYFSGPNKYTVIEPHHFLPFLSWMPRRVASLYVRIARGAKEYSETPLDQNELKKISSRFKIFDYTTKVIKHPKKYFATHRWQRLFSLIPQSSFRIFLYNMPSFFWILYKNEKK